MGINDSEAEEKKEYRLHRGVVHVRQADDRSTGVARGREADAVVVPSSHVQPHGEAADIETKDRYHENCYLIVLLAEYEDGRKRFALGDNLVLRERADFIVIQRVVNFIYSTHVMTNKEAKQAVEENPTSASASA